MMPTITELLWDKGMHLYYNVHGIVERKFPRIVDDLWHRVSTHALFALETPMSVANDILGVFYSHERALDVEEDEDGVDCGIRAKLRNDLDKLRTPIFETYVDIERILQDICVCAKKPTSHSWLILQAKHVERTSQWLKQEAGEMRVKQDEDVKRLFREHRKLSRFALNIYDASVQCHHYQWANTLGLEGAKEGDIKMFEPKSQKCSMIFAKSPISPKYGIFIDHESKRVVLGIRGTMNIRDVLSDMQYDDLEDTGNKISDKITYAHQGCFIDAVTVRDHARDKIVEALEKHQGYKLLVTGHSLGAGVAVLVTLIWMRDPQVSEKLECIALAPPPVLRTEDKELLKRAEDIIHIYIHRHDMVPRLGLGTIARLIRGLHSVDMQDHGMIRRWLLSWGVLAASTRPEHDEGVKPDWFVDHPGRIHFLIPADGTSTDKYWLASLPQEDFSRKLHLHPHFIVDHIPDSYKYAMENTLVD